MKYNDTIKISDYSRLEPYYEKYIMRYIMVNYIIKPKTFLQISLWIN